MQHVVNHNNAVNDIQIKWIRLNGFDIHHQNEFVIKHT